MKKILFLSIILSCILNLLGESNIDLANRYAYASNFGWIDWGMGTNQGATIGEYVCSGYIYSGNVGWINLGSGTPTNGIYYGNNSPGDFGVNNDGLGNLRGFAYGANIGWINFESMGAPKVDLLSGRLSGFVWSCNCGWISLSNAFAYVEVDSIQQGTLAPDGIPIAWLLSNFGTTNVNANADADGDGMSNLEEYLAGTDPNNANNNLRVIGFSCSSNGANVSVEWTSVPTRSYHLQNLQSLNSADWSDSGLGVISSGGSSTSCSLAGTNALMRYYRVQAFRPLMQ